MMAQIEVRHQAPINTELAGTQTVGFNPNLHTLTWERLETLRLKSLGIPNRFSRHCNTYTQSNVTKSHFRPPVTPTFEQTLRASTQPIFNGHKKTTKLGAKGTAKTPNSLAPFYTLGKPTCGFFFSRFTDNKKRDIGIPPSDLVQWRSFVMH
ncbi:uncharacterized protein [Haliotis cracherodii]|uniref:uncharacterized protein n=1 Tax=Haliotis cracherodii TaxID=6455 RepID=UPI0039E8EFFF